MKTIRSAEEVEHWRVAERIPKRIRVHEMSEPFAVLIGAEWQRGSAGDYISLDETGRLGIIPGAIFDSYYRKIQ